MIRPGRPHPGIAAETAPDRAGLRLELEPSVLRLGDFNGSIAPGYVAHQSRSERIVRRAHDAFVPCIRPAFVLRLRLSHPSLSLARSAAVGAPDFLLTPFLVTVQHPPAVRRSADHDLQSQTQVWRDPLVEPVPCAFHQSGSFRFGNARMAIEH